jgi:transposase InsO family protein
VNVYPFIEAENARGAGTVERACGLLEVSRSAYYAHRAGQSGRRARADAVLTEKIRRVHHESGGTYGAPRVQAELADRGDHHARKRIARLLREARLVGQAPRRWRTNTVADPAATRPPDLIDRDFSCGSGGIDTRWCGDITYIHTWEGWMYLATVIDLDSRRVVGWATGEDLRTDLVERAPAAAVDQRRPQPGVIFHSDRGCQYTSAQYARAARSHNVRLSVGRTGVCWDNAVAESFFATLKNELVNQRAWPTKVSVRSALFEWIEGWS